MVREVAPLEVGLSRLLEIADRIIRAKHILKYKALSTPALGQGRAWQFYPGRSRNIETHTTLVFMM